MNLLIVKEDLLVLFIKYFIEKSVYCYIIKNSAVVQE